MIRVLLVDDHLMFRDSLKKMISLEEDMIVVGECAGGNEVLLEVENSLPDIVLMDINMPRMNGVEATNLLQLHKPEIKTIVLSIHDDESYVFLSLRYGAVGYLLKDMEANQLIDAIRTVYNGQVYVHPRVTGSLVDEFRRLTLQEMREKGSQLTCNILSERELEVLNEVARGQSNREIGEKLFISEKTVKNHLSNILEKLEVNDRTQAVVIAIKNGWIEA